MAEERKAKVDNVGVFSDELIATSDEKLELRYSHIVLGFSVAVVFSSAILLSHYVSIESVFMLITFNFLFVSLTFPLNGSLATKVLLLSTGNLVGVLWAFLFSVFVHTVANYFGAALSILYLIFGPFVNLVWIVTFYSLSLTVLSSRRNRKRKD